MTLAAIRIHPVKSLRGVACATARVEPWGLAGDRRWMVVDAADRFLTQREHPEMARVAASEVPAEEDGAGALLLAAAGRTLRVATPGDDAETLQVTVWRDTVPARLASGAAAAFLSESIGVNCRLVWLADPTRRPIRRDSVTPGRSVSFADAFPVLLANTASLDDLNGRLASRVSISRFRPNLVVSGAAAWDEDRWRRIRIGAAVFTVAAPCERCAVTTIDSETGARPDPREPLRTLARFRKPAGAGVMFGQNLLVEVEPGGAAIRVGDPIEVLERGPPNVVHGR